MPLASLLAIFCITVAINDVFYDSENERKEDGQTYVARKDGHYVFSRRPSGPHLMEVLQVPKHKLYSVLSIVLFQSFYRSKMTLKAVFDW